METEILLSKLPAVFVETDEGERLQNFLPKIECEVQATWRPYFGLEAEIAGYVSQDRKTLTRSLEFVLNHKSSVFAIFYNPHIEYDPREHYQLLKEITHKKDHTIILCGPQYIDLPELFYYKLPAPTQEEYVAKFEKLGKPKNKTQRNYLNTCAKYSAGMRLCEAQNCFRASNNSQYFIYNKSQFMKTSVIDFVNTDKDLDKDLGGFHELKSWFKKRAHLYKNEAKDYGISPCRGIILSGKSGCGKSLVAKSLSNYANLPLVRLDIAKCFNQYVGESERIFRQALQSIENVSPCVLWLDELNRALTGGDSSGDSGTTSRIVGEFLTWLQEHDKDIFTVATVNSTDQLPQELLRPGRFDKQFEVELPNYDEREEIWCIHLQKRNIWLTKEEISDMISTSSSLTGADIEQVCENALIEAFNQGLSKEEIGFDLIRSCI